MLEGKPLASSAMDVESSDNVKNQKKNKKNKIRRKKGKQYDDGKPIEEDKEAEEISPSKRGT